MTINKALGQMLKCVGTHLPPPVPPPPHGQLYVAFSRTSSFDKVTVVIIEGHRQRTESDTLITSMYIEKCFKFQIYKQIFIDYILYSSYVRIIRRGTTNT
jgi:hypothetical protein